MGASVSKAFKGRRSSQSVKPKAQPGGWNCVKSQPNVHEHFPAFEAPVTVAKPHTQTDESKTLPGSVAAGSDYDRSTDTPPDSPTDVKVAKTLEPRVSSKLALAGTGETDNSLETPDKDLISVGSLSKGSLSHGTAGDRGLNTQTPDAAEHVQDAGRSALSPINQNDSRLNGHSGVAVGERLNQMPKNWKKGDNIGSGSFGSVFLGLNCDTGELLAVKEVAVQAEPSKLQESVDQLEQEVGLLSSLSHPNIVSYIGTLREDKHLYIFLEYVPGGSIASLLARFGSFDESVIKVYCRQVLDGLEYLHGQRTVHRDIKGGNILVEKSGRIKLADFGMAKQMVEHMSCTRSFKGSAFWMAPEVIRQRGHGVAADIWSIGCTVLEMATGKPPWSQCSTQVQAIFKIASSSELPAIPETLSPAASEFILLCLQRDPSARPTATSLLAHQFVRNTSELIVYPGEMSASPEDILHPGKMTNSASRHMRGSRNEDTPGSTRRSSSYFSSTASPRAGSRINEGEMTSTTGGDRIVGIDDDRIVEPGRGGQASSIEGHRRTHSESAGRGGTTSSTFTRGQSYSQMEHMAQRGRGDVGDHEEFSLFPQRFKVQGLLGLPPLKFPNGGNSHMKTGSTPVKGKPLLSSLPPS